MYRELLSHPDPKKKWILAMCRVLGRLTQGYCHHTTGTNTIFFFSADKIKPILPDQTVTYTIIVVDYRPQKKDPNCLHITVRGS